MFVNENVDEFLDITLPREDTMLNVHVVTVAHQSIMKVKIPGPPIVCAVAFSPDSKSVTCCFENAGAKRGMRV